MGLSVKVLTLAFLQTQIKKCEEALEKNKNKDLIQIMKSNLELNKRLYELTKKERDPSENPYGLD